MCPRVARRPACASGTDSQNAKEVPFAFYIKELDCSKLLFTSENNLLFGVFGCFQHWSISRARAAPNPAETVLHTSMRILGPADNHRRGRGLLNDAMGVAK